MTLYSPKITCPDRSTISRDVTYCTIKRRPTTGTRLFSKSIPVQYLWCIPHVRWQVQTRDRLMQRLGISVSNTPAHLACLICDSFAYFTVLEYNTNFQGVKIKGIWLFCEVIGIFDEGFCYGHLYIFIRQCIRQNISFYVFFK